jgi:hypothetical protein
VLLNKCTRGVGHEWQIEVLAYAGELGLKIVECPITYTAGRSSLNHRTLYRASRMWLHVFSHVPSVKEEKIRHGSEKDSEKRSDNAESDQRRQLDRRPDSVPH